MLEIDGSSLEGGGQILRTSLALSCILGKPAHIANIRAGREKPGLKAQHLAGILALQKICNARVNGAAIGSTEVSFEPGAISGGEFAFDVGTAGAISLVLQSIVPVLLFASKPSHIAITGGTHVDHSPTIDYTQKVLLPALAEFGARTSLEIGNYGFYPKGGGKVVLKIEPIAGGKLKAARFDGTGTNMANAPIRGVSIASNLPQTIADRQANSAGEILGSCDVPAISVKTSCPGTAITLWKGFLGASSLGKIGKSAEKVGEEAATALKQEIDAGACVDVHLADQLMIFAALAHGESKIRTSEISSHAKTNASVIGQFCNAGISLDENEKVIMLRGIDFSKK
ncbi:RNA 3'-terminal phosphate cyclase [Candidatus Gugararchaeum adminiculabundum]|nr:RNA 3'-terminal phosphate cyclase [Candidatus Gugararchaeum adminiculabundum]